MKLRNLSAFFDRILMVLERIALTGHPAGRFWLRQHKKHEDKD